MTLGELSELSDNMGLEGTGKMTADNLRDAIRAERVAPKPKMAPAPQSSTEPAETSPTVAAPIGDPDFVPHTDAQRRKIMVLLNNLGFKADAEKHQVAAGILGLTPPVSFKTMSIDQANTLIDSLEQADASEGGAEGLRMFFVVQEGTDAPQGS